MGCASLVFAYPAPQATPEPAALPALAPVASIDLARYAGTWYQVALIPNRFQKQCLTDTTATYRLQADGKVEVKNRCRTAKEGGKNIEEALGEARPNAKAGAKLKAGTLVPPKLQVRFAPAWLGWLDAVWGDYWVIQLAPDYSYAVVGEPSRQFLWVLARTPRLSAKDRSAIDVRLREQGYNPALLRDEKHAP